MRRIILILAILFFTSIFSFATTRLDQEQIIKHVNHLNILDAHARVCSYDPNLCETSSRLIKKFAKNYNKLYLSIIQYESQNFTKRIGNYDKTDLGLAQINIRYWPPETLRKFGFNIKYGWQLYENDVLSLNAGYTILWYSIVTAYRRGIRYNNLLDYATYYHSVKRNLIYLAKVKSIYYNSLQ